MIDIASIPTRNNNDDDEEGDNGVSNEAL